MPLAVTPTLEYLLNDGPSGVGATDSDGVVIPTGDIFRDNSGHGHHGYRGIPPTFNSYGPAWLAGSPSPGLAANGQWHVPEAARAAAFGANAGAGTVHMVVNVTFPIPTASLQQPNHQGLSTGPQMQLELCDGQFAAGSPATESFYPRQPMKGYCLLTVVFGATPKFYLNGVEVTANGVPSASLLLPSSTPTGNGWQWGTNGQSNFLGTWHYFALFGSALSAANVAADFTYISGLMTARGITLANGIDTTKPLVMVLGDSIAAGSTIGTPHNSYTVQNRYATDPGGTGAVAWCVSAFGGRASSYYFGLSAVASTWTTGVLPVLNQFSGDKIVVFAFGANDIGGGGTAADLESRATVAMAATRAAGGKFVLVSILPSTTGTWNNSKDTQRRAFNAWADANQSLFDGYVPVHLEPHIGLVYGFSGTYPSGLNPADNTTYYNGDKIHPVDQGHAVLAPLVLYEINRILGHRSFNAVVFGNNFGGGFQ